MVEHLQALPEPLLGRTTATITPSRHGPAIPASTGPTTPSLAPRRPGACLNPGTPSPAPASVEQWPGSRTLRARPDTRRNDMEPEQPTSKLGPYPRCRGTLAYGEDRYGPYVGCLHCGKLIDLLATAHDAPVEEPDNLPIQGGAKPPQADRTHDPGTPGDVPGVVRHHPEGGSDGHPGCRAVRRQLSHHLPDSAQVWGRARPNGGI